MSLVALLVGSFAVTPAQADSFWHVLGGMRIGGVHFSVGYDSPYRHHHRGRYYRTEHRLKHRGYRCGSACYRRGGYYYHHESCPLLEAYVYDADPPYYDRYERYGRYDRRYDRHYRYRDYDDDSDSDSDRRRWRRRWRW